MTSKKYSQIKNKQNMEQYLYLWNKPQGFIVNYILSQRFQKHNMTLNFQENVAAEEPKSERNINASNSR